MKLLTLPLAVRRRLIEHEPDVLAPALEGRTQKFSVPCPRCGGAMHQRLAERAFNTNSVLPRTSARCVDCGHEIDTQSGMVMQMGNPAQVEPALPIIKPKDD